MNLPARHKIINDPVYGFITIRHSLILQLIDHPLFQRLRRIAQLGLSHLVYPGAVHNRFQHALGTIHLMQNTIDELRLKGIDITADEETGLLAASLLHDIGHGPFSHALEHSIVQGVKHEQLSLLLMKRLNRELSGALDTALAIFSNTYPKRFLHQLVSSQLDMDRLDYLARDSFFSGVVEGQVGSERIIKMLDVVDDQLVVEEKGIYSIEKFIVARRFMYWQVYLHKTVLSAEFMLVNALRRARWLCEQGREVFATPALHFFLLHSVSQSEIEQSDEVFGHFSALDDYDITTALKAWQSHPDTVLREISTRIIERRLFKIELSAQPFADETIAQHRLRVARHLAVESDEASFFVIHDKVDNTAYHTLNDSIKIKLKSGRVLDAATASDHLNIAALSQPVEKWFLSYLRS